jgi:ABC-type antimicrobial peptide transport system permease subunit
MEALVEGALGQTRIVGDLLTLFSAMAAALAGLGLFGLLAYTVAQRVREIGVRMALGASTGQVVRLVAGQGLRLAGIGIAVGIGAAFGLTRLLRGVLFEVEPADPVTFGLTAAGLLGVAVAAAVIPARRAARTDPVVVLRE